MGGTPYKSAIGWVGTPYKSAIGWVLFQMFLHLTMKEHPCRVYSDSMPLKQIIEQWRATEPPSASRSCPTAHDTLNGTMSMV